MTSYCLLSIMCDQGLLLGTTSWKRFVRHGTLRTDSRFNPTARDSSSAGFWNAPFPRNGFYLIIKAQSSRFIKTGCVRWLNLVMLAWYTQTESFWHSMIFSCYLQTAKLYNNWPKIFLFFDYQMELYFLLEHRLFTQCQQHWQTCQRV